MLRKKSFEPAAIVSLALPGVFLVGGSTILLPWYLYFDNRTSLIEGGVSTIGRAAALMSGNHVFMVGMNITAICILITWGLVFQLNSARIRLLARPNFARALNLVACLLGVFSGVLLSLSAFPDFGMLGLEPD